MSKPAKRGAMSLAKFAETLNVSVEGQSIPVPITSESNKWVTCLLVSQMRKVYQDNLKKILDQDVVINPREMKDMIDAAAKLAQTAGEAYQALDGIDMSEKTVQPAGEETVDEEPIDFTEIKTPEKHEQRHDTETPDRAPDGSTS